MQRSLLIFILLVFVLGNSLSQELSEKELELIEASEKGDNTKVLKLLNDSVPVNIEDWYGMGPLHYAIQNGHLKTVKTLVLNGASVDKKDYDSRTPLHMAVHFNHLDIAEYLVQNQADINTRDNYDLSPLFYSSAYGDYIMTDMLLFYSDGDVKELKDPEGRNQFLVAVWGGHLEVAQLLLKYFPDINTKDNSQNNAIHLATINEDIQMIDSLYKWGCDLQAVNESGYSGLDLAIRENSEKTVTKLIELGADVNHKINKGFNSLDLAVSKTNNPVLISILEEAGAKRNRRLSFSQPALTLHINTGLKDAFGGLKFEVWEPKYGISIGVGATQRLGRLKVLGDPEDGIRYQFRESRTGITAGINKHWMLVRINGNKRVGMATGLDMGLFFGQNKGSTVAPEIILTPLPSFGLYWQSGSWTFAGTALYQNLKTYQLPAIRLGISLSYRFNEFD